MVIGCVLVEPDNDEWLVFEENEGVVEVAAVEEEGVVAGVSLTK